MRRLDSGFLARCGKQGSEMQPSAKLPSYCASGPVFAAFVCLLPSLAAATPPCEPDEPCHNNPAEPGIMFGFGADAFAAGLVTTIGNSVALGRGRRANLGWIVTGYLAATYNLVLGITWTSTAGPDLREFPDDDYAWMMLGVGLTHLVWGSMTLAIAAAAHGRRRAMLSAGGASLAPAVSAIPGGACITIGGRF